MQSVYAHAQNPLSLPARNHTLGTPSPLLLCVLTYLINGPYLQIQCFKCTLQFVDQKWFFFENICIFCY